MLRRSAYIPTPTFVYKKNAGGGACIDIGVHILDLTLWMMGHPTPVAVSGVARTELAKRENVFSAWHPGDMPKDIDVEEFAAAFVRFENGATMMLESTPPLRKAPRGTSLIKRSRTASSRLWISSAFRSRI